MRRFMLCLGAIALLASAGCGDDRALKAELDGRSYLGVATSDPRAVRTPSMLRLLFGDEGLSATGGCNDTDGSYQLSGRKLRFGDDATQTVMSCPGESQDAWLNDLLTPSADLQLRDGGRTLILRRGQRSATFELQRANGGPTPVDGRRLRAYAFTAGDGRMMGWDQRVDPPTIRISGAVARIFTGCNRGVASVRVGERDLEFGAFRPATHRSCSSRIAGIERGVLRAVTGTVRVQFRGAHDIGIVRPDERGLLLTDRPVASADMNAGR